MWVVKFVNKWFCARTIFFFSNCKPSVSLCSSGFLIAGQSLTDACPSMVLWMVIRPRNTILQTLERRWVGSEWEQWKVCLDIASLYGTAKQFSMENFFLRERTFFGPRCGTAWAGQTGEHIHRALSRRQSLRAATSTLEGNMLSLLQYWLSSRVKKVGQWRVTVFLCEMMELARNCYWPQQLPTLCSIFR